MNTSSTNIDGFENEDTNTSNSTENFENDDINSSNNTDSFEQEVRVFIYNYMILDKVIDQQEKKKLYN